MSNNNNNNLGYVQVYDKEAGIMRKFEKEQGEDYKKIPVNKELIEEIAKEILKK